MIISVITEATRVDVCTILTTKLLWQPPNVLKSHVGYVYIVLKPAVFSPSESKLHHVNCIQCSDACYTHLTVQAPAVVAHLAGDAPLCRHCPIQFFAGFVQYLWSLHHCSLFLAFLGVFIRGLAHWLCLCRSQPILYKAVYIVRNWLLCQQQVFLWLWLWLRKVTSAAIAAAPEDA